MDKVDSKISAAQYLYDYFSDKPESQPVRVGRSWVWHPVRRTSSLGVWMISSALLYIVPISIFAALQTSDDIQVKLFVWDIAALVTILPVTIYFVLQGRNSITLNTVSGWLTYTTAIRTSVSFKYESLEGVRSPLTIIYFNNTTAKSMFNKNGWAGVYRNGNLLFRLNMDRWDEKGLWALAEKTAARIMVINRLTDRNEIERRFPHYFPMFAIKPVLSLVLSGVGITIALASQIFFWIAAS